MRKQIILPAVAVFLTITIGATAAPPGGRHRGPGGPEMGPRMPGRFLDNPDLMDELQLSEQQIASLRKIRFEAQKNHVTLQADAAQARLVVHDLLSQDQPPEEELMSAIEKAGQAKIAMRKSNVRHMLKIRELVGPDKWQKLRERGRKQHGRRPHQPKHDGESDIRF